MLLIQLNVTVTLVLFHPAELGDGDTDAEIVGRACSRLTVAEVLAAFPATSVAVPEIDWLAPLVETVVALGHTATPDNESLQIKVTVTGTVSHPAEFGVGERLAVIVGGVLSSLMTTVAVFVPPAASITVPVTGTLAPSVETTCGEVQLMIGAPPGVQLKLTVTLALFQPAAFGCGETLAKISGAVRKCSA